MIKLMIPGEPVAKSRARITRYGAYTPTKTKNYETLVSELYSIKHGQTLLEGELEVKLNLYFKIPKSTSKKKRTLIIEESLRPTKKPDVDNCLKCITDALNNLAYKDDSQIVKALVEKYYSEEPRAELIIKRIGE